MTYSKTATYSSNAYNDMSSRRWTHAKHGYLTKSAKRDRRLRAKASRQERTKKRKTHPDYSEVRDPLPGNVSLRSMYRKECVNIPWKRCSGKYGAGWFHPTTGMVNWYDREPSPLQSIRWVSTAPTSNLPRATLPSCYLNRYVEEKA